SRSFEISIYVTNMASMIGIGVAVDYSLFIVSRFRRELHTGATRDDALARALRSSGTAVVFSAATVAISLAALFAIDVNAIRSMAVGAIVVVCISALASITLLPALLSAVGGRVDRLRIPLPWRTSEAGSDAFWSGWARGANGRQWLVDATLAVPAESSKAQDIVHRIEETAGPDALVGGSTVFEIDVTRALVGGLWKVLLVILGACYVVLLVLLRSVLL